MSTSEKQEPSTDAKPEETDRVSGHIPCFVFAICCAAFGLTSFTCINAEDSSPEGMVKLLPGFGAAMVIQAITLHASLLRAVWKGRYPDETMSPCQMLARQYYCCTFTLKHWRHLLAFLIGVLCAFSADHSLWEALRYAREIAERGRPSRAESAAEKGRVSTTESAAEDGQGNPSPLRRSTIFCMLFFSIAGFSDLGNALYVGKIDTALSIFGPCFLAALVVAVLMLRVATLFPRVLRCSNS